MVLFLAILGGLTILGFMVTYVNKYNHKQIKLEVEKQTVTITTKMIDEILKKTKIKTKKSRIVFEAVSIERKRIIRAVIARFRENPNETDRKLLYDDMLIEQGLVEQGRLPIKHRVYDWDLMNELGMDIKSIYNPNRFKDEDEILIETFKIIGKNKYLNTNDNFGKMEEGIVK